MLAAMQLPWITAVGLHKLFWWRDVLWELSIIHMLEKKKKRQANEINTTDNAINSFASFMNANQNSVDMINVLCMQSFIKYAFSGFNVVVCVFHGVSRHMKYSLEVRRHGQVTFIVLIKCILRLTTE